MDLKSLSKRLRPLELEHPDFGHLTFERRRHQWSRFGSSMWGYPDLQFVIDAFDSGPTTTQVAEYHRFAASKEALLPRSIEALRKLPLETAEQPPVFVLTGLAIPRLDDGEGGELWNLRFDLVGDDHYMYGIQTLDRWVTISPCMDD